MSAKKVVTRQRTTFLIKELQSRGAEVLKYLRKQYGMGQKTSEFKVGKTSVGMEEEKDIVEFGKKESQNVNEINNNNIYIYINFLSFHLLRFVVFY